MQATAASRTCLDLRRGVVEFTQGVVEFGRPHVGLRTQARRRHAPSACRPCSNADAAPSASRWPAYASTDSSSSHCGCDGGHRLILRRAPARRAARGVQIPQQDPVQRPLEQIDAVVGVDQELHVAFEQAALCGGERAQGRERNLQQRQAQLRVEPIEEWCEPRGFGRHAAIRAVREIRQLPLPHAGLRIQEQAVDDRAGAVRLPRRGDQIGGQAVAQLRRLANVCRSGLPDARHGAGKSDGRGRNPRRGRGSGRAGRRLGAGRAGRQGGIELSVPRRIDAPDAFGERRMRGEQRVKPDVASPKNMWLASGAFGF